MPVQLCLSLRTQVSVEGQEQLGEEGGSPPMAVQQGQSSPYSCLCGSSLCPWGSASVLQFISCLGETKLLQAALGLSPVLVFLQFSYSLIF